MKNCRNISAISSAAAATAVEISLIKCAQSQKSQKSQLTNHINRSSCGMSSVCAVSSGSASQQRELPKLAHVHCQRHQLRCCTHLRFVAPRCSHIRAPRRSLHSAYASSCAFTCMSGCLMYALHLRSLPWIFRLPPGTLLPPAVSAFTMHSPLLHRNSAAKLTHNLWVVFDWYFGTQRTLLALHPNASQLNGLSVLHEISNGIMQPPYTARLANNLSAAIHNATAEMSMRRNAFITSAKFRNPQLLDALCCNSTTIATTITNSNNVNNCNRPYRIAIVVFSVFSADNHVIVAIHVLHS